MNNTDASCSVLFEEFWVSSVAAVIKVTYKVKKLNNVMSVMTQAF
ncbi:hypothetical protein AOT82_592 [Psychrobacter sp. AntiMn-1]|nr:hypothetical protein AOT82_592 [Psychrobacter sp. AntiMn-1]